MASKTEVAQFLKEFKFKLSIYQILFRDERKKNSQFLLTQELTPASRIKVIESLEVEDYSEGPLDDTLYGIASMNVFGKRVKKTEIYIKISMGRPNDKVLCISFHDAEEPMNYPFKEYEYEKSDNR